MSLILQIQQSNELIQISDLMQIRSSYPETQSELLDTEARFKIELTETQNRIFFLGKTQTTLPAVYVQLVLINADNDPELANGQDIAHVHDLRVRLDLQGEGYGQQMIKYLEEEAHKRGIQTLTLGVDSWNARAIEFYNQLGYQKFKEAEGRTQAELVFMLRKTLDQ